MNTQAIAINDRFTDVELFDLFNIDIMPDAPHEEGDRRPYDDESAYVFNDIKCQLWSHTKRTLPRGERNALQGEDHCSVSEHPPGSAGRIADLAAHYQGVEWDAEEGDHESAFAIPEHVSCPSCGWHCDPEANYCTACGKEL
jgi:hypothetical protein